MKDSPFERESPRREMLDATLDMLLSSPLTAILFAVVFVIMALSAIVKLFPEVLSRKEEEEVQGGEPLPEELEATFAHYLNKGNEYLGQYEFDKALAQFQEAVKLKGNDPSVHFKIGRIFLQKDDPRNAAIAFKNVLNLKPDQIEAHYELARIAMQQQQPEQAHEALNYALKINPDHEETLKLKVKLLESEGQYHQALPILQKLMDKSRQGKRHRLQYADFLTKVGKNEEAIQQYLQLLDTDASDNLLYRRKIGQVYF